MEPLRVCLLAVPLSPGLHDNIWTVCKYLWLVLPTSLLKWAGEDTEGITMECTTQWGWWALGDGDWRGDERMQSVVISLYPGISSRGKKKLLVVYACRLQYMVEEMWFKDAVVTVGINCKRARRRGLTIRWSLTWYWVSDERVKLRLQISYKKIQVEYPRIVLDLIHPMNGQDVMHLISKRWYEVIWMEIN